MGTGIPRVGWDRKKKKNPALFYISVTTVVGKARSVSLVISDSAQNAQRLRWSFKTCKSNFPFVIMISFSNSLYWRYDILEDIRVFT